MSALGLSRTIRLVPSTGAFGSHSSPSSPGRVTRASSDDLAADNSEEMEARGKDLATKCWVDDESFLGKEKIAEWLGGLYVTDLSSYARDMRLSAFH